MEITLFLVGFDADDAQESLFFDSIESAKNFILDTGGKEPFKVFSVEGMIDFTTIEEIK